MIKKKIGETEEKGEKGINYELRKKKKKKGIFSK
jgi:hypothetical protein